MNLCRHKLRPDQRVLSGDSRAVAGAFQLSGISDRRNLDSLDRRKSRLHSSVPMLASVAALSYAPATPFVAPRAPAVSMMESKADLVTMAEKLNPVIGFWCAD